MLNMSSNSFRALSQPLSKTRNIVVRQKIFSWLLQCDFLIQKLFLASGAYFKKASYIDLQI